MTVTIDGSTVQAASGELLVNVINRSGNALPQIRYHPQLGSIQTCDTCMVEVDGTLARACGTRVGDRNMAVLIGSGRARAARFEAMDVILSNHELYCTVCDQQQRK